MALLYVVQQESADSKEQVAKWTGQRTTMKQRHYGLAQQVL
jgi:hypothetical protein